MSYIYILVYRNIKVSDHFSLCITWFQYSSVIAKTQKKFSNMQSLSSTRIWSVQPYVRQTSRLISPILTTFQATRTAGCEFRLLHLRGAVREGISNRADMSAQTLSLSLTALHIQSYCYFGPHLDRVDWATESNSRCFVTCISCILAPFNYIYSCASLNCIFSLPYLSAA